MESNVDTLNGMLKQLNNEFKAANERNQSAGKLISEAAADFEAREHPRAGYQVTLENVGQKRVGTSLPIREPGHTVASLKGQFRDVLAGHSAIIGNYMEMFVAQRSMLKLIQDYVNGKDWTGAYEESTILLWKKDETLRKKFKYDFSAYLASLEKQAAADKKGRT